VQAIHTVGCCKAYDTKVGTHVFISEIEEGHPLRAHLSQLEFGSTTGRQRMVGWFDAVEKGDALRYGGYQDLALNKLDALSYQGPWQEGELLICTGYEAPDGGRMVHVPRNDSLRRQLKPIFTKCPGWSEDISGVRHFADLPLNAQNYVKAMLRAIVNVALEGNLQSATLPNLRYLGVGPAPDQIIKDIPSTKELLAK
jgi:adenylosuccinate synthase